jgi:MYXO-CTERM domain-containing protein
MSLRWREVRVYLRSVFLLTTVAACGNSSGCSGCDADSTPFPDKDKIQSAVQIRLTSDGIGFLEENLEPLISEAVPDGLNICLPGAGGSAIGVDYGYCQDEICDTGERGCQLTIGIGPIDLEAIPVHLADGTLDDRNAKLRASLTFSELHARIDVAATPVVDCTLSIDAPGFPVTVDLDLTTPDPTRYLSFTLSDAQYSLAELNLRLEAGGGGFLDPLCTIIDGALNFPFIGDLIYDLIQGFTDDLLLDLIAGFIEDFTCATCEDVGDCPVEENPSCDGGRCMLDNGTCIPAPLGLEGMVDVGEMLSGVSPGLSAPLQYLANPGSYVQVENDGLSLGLIAGAVSEKNRCVPRRAQPVNEEPPRAEIFRGNVGPNGQGYEVGIGISDTIVEHALWAAYNGGALCLAISGDTVEQISTSTLGIAVPGLRRIARGPALMALTLAPQEVPTVIFGENTTRVDEDGNYALDDPLMTIGMQDLWIDFHIFMEGRWTRVFSLRADVVVPLGLAFAPDNGIIPVLGDLSAALQNIETANGEILPDDLARLEMLLPALLGPLLNGATASLADPIALPDIMGYQLNLQDGAITSVANNTMLGIFAALERNPDVNDGEGVGFSVDTAFEVIETHIPPTADFVEDGTGVWRRPFVQLAVDAWDGTTDDADMEYSVQVDDHSWSLFSPAVAGEITVRSPAFGLQGKHTVRLRARRQDEYRSLDLTPAQTQVIIDSIAPTVSVAANNDGEIVVRTDDLVSDAPDIDLALRLDDGHWQPLAQARFEAPEGVDRVTVRATDEAGNSAELHIAAQELGLIGRLPVDPNADPEAGGCGCDVQRDSTPPAAFWLAMVALLGLRRRRRWGALAAATLLFLGAGCDDDPPAKHEGDGGMVDPCDQCADDEACRDGVCFKVSCSERPAVCDDFDCSGDRAATCVEGFCQCEPFCGGDCGEGEFCCEQANACQAVPDPCADTQCDAGFVPAISQAGTANAETCQLEGGACDCVEAEPLDAGFIGRFSDFALVDQSTAWFSAYADDYGDLVVGRYTIAGGFEWHWVDGVPEGDVVGSPSGPRGGVEDEGPDVGQHTSIAVAPDGAVHVVYHDVDNDALKYARGEADGAAMAWHTSTIDTEGGAGRWATITLDAQGVPGVAYQVASLDNGEGPVSQVRFLLAKNASPAAAADWNPVFVLHQTALPDADPETGSYPEGTGLHLSQTRDPDGMPVVAWYDRTGGAMWVSRFIDAGFAEPEMLAGWGHPEREGDMGANVDVAVDANNNLHLCYQDGLTDSLRYLAPELGLDVWIDDGVRIDYGGREYANHIVGDDCNMLLDGDGNPVIVYQDATGHDLLLSRGDLVGGGWVRITLRGTEAMYQGAFGFYARAAFMGGTVWTSNYVYNNQIDPVAQYLEVLRHDL